MMWICTVGSFRRYISDGSSHLRIVLLFNFMTMSHYFLLKLETRFLYITNKDAGTLFIEEKHHPLRTWPSRNSAIEKDHWRIRRRMLVYSIKSKAFVNQKIKKYVRKDYVDRAVIQWNKVGNDDCAHHFGSVLTFQFDRTQMNWMSQKWDIPNGSDPAQNSKQIYILCKIRIYVASSKCASWCSAIFQTHVCRWIILS